MTERVVIVGGTSGIGLATAQHLVDSGREVVVTGRDTAKLATALERLGKNATGEAVDARDPKALEEFFTGIGQVDHVVVTATGPSGATPFAELTTAHLRAGLEGKLVAHAAVAHAALPVLREDGSLTLVSAASAGAAMPATAHLAAVNAGVEAMVPVLAVELKPLRVNAVSPGVVDTPWWDFLGPEAREQAFAALASATPAGRVGRPEDIASAISFLIDNTFTTGVVLRVDGGARLGSAA
ncbi:MAG TPA: SDR family oxidoreductase [Amycolatopsis sp.]|uniref:SDR family oxidoreductase n=1 Tax=Amycolatopsis sp. TaxID=37632 RepID=UPI002B497B99|nr:SDR family oxidoreductase [Amycolatopsis sp.]HKS43786.1 SDR family oxidoreductase [Amycolatopsis sp.]